MRCFAAGTVPLRFTAALKLEVVNCPLLLDWVDIEVAFSYRQGRMAQLILDHFEIDTVSSKRIGMGPS